MYKTLNISGLAGEQFVYSVLGYADVTDNVIFRTFITFTYENTQFYTRCALTKNIACMLSLKKIEYLK